MKTEIMRSQTPEEKELQRKLSILAELKAELAQRELDLATLRADLLTFEARYVRIVGVRLSELDEIEAQIAEAEAQLKPGDNRVQEQAAQARARAQESAKATEFTREAIERKFRPSESLKKLYRTLAKQIHPDLAVDDVDHARRQKLMAEANRAYEEGDEAKLRAILDEWDSSPESVKGEGTAADLVRVIRRISQIKQRLRAIELEISELKESDLYQLRIKTEAAELEGQDLLSAMASNLEKKIDSARRRLQEIIKGSRNSEQESR